MADREEEREHLRAERLAVEGREAGSAQRKRRVQYLSIAAFAAVAVIVALIVISQSGGGGDGGGSPSDIQGTDQVSAELSGISQRGNVLGDPSAPVSVVEFGDPQCPVCASFATQILPQLLEDEVRPGNATYEYRAWVIIGPDSKPASKAALAAGEQNRLFQFIQLFYANQGTENSGYVTDAFMESIAKAAGVPDIDQWNRDRNDPKWDAELARDNADADSLGFTGTPSILVTGPNGQKPLSGFGLSEIESAIQQVS
jgi:protein-disulfide isomerase